MKKYVAKYTYDRPEVEYDLPEANGSFHFFSANDLNEANEKAKNDIAELLEYRFAQKVSFEIELIDELN